MDEKPSNRIEEETKWPQIASLADLVETKTLANSIAFNALTNAFAEIKKSSDLVSKAYSSSLVVPLTLGEMLAPIIEEQVRFREDFLKGISPARNIGLTFDKIIKEWAEISLSVQTNISGIKFDFEYTKKSYTEHRQVVVELDQGINENGLEVYQTFEKDGKKYKLVAIPDDYTESSKQITTSLGYSDDYQTANITTTFSTKSNTKIHKLKFKYNSKSHTIFVGNHSHTLSISKSFNFLNHCLSEIFKDKNQTIWYFKDLLDSFDRELNTKDTALKQCKNWFDYFKKSLIPEIQDLFIIGNKYIKINSKYR